MYTNPQELMKTATRYFVNAHFRDMYGEERTEAIWNFLLADKAEEEGHPEVAEILREIARDELKHAIWMGKVAEKPRLDGHTLVHHLETAMVADDNVVDREREIAQMARLLEREKDAGRFEQMANDELDHVEKFKRALELLENKNS